MSGFSNAVVGGSGILKRIAIRSVNYVAGLTGWTINKDGSAEFNNLTVRGTFAGLDFIIDSTGAFFYSGVPGAGNTPVAVLGVVATDPFGNDVTPGDASALGSVIAIGATPSGGTPSFIQLAPATPSAQVNIGSGDVLEASAAHIDSLISGGGASRNLNLRLTSPKASGFPNAAASMFLASKAVDGSSDPLWLVTATDGSGTSSSLEVTPAGTIVAVGPLVSTSGTASKPSLIVTDNFTSLLPVAVTGYAVSVCRYRLEANGMMCFDLQMRAGAGGGTAGTYVLTTTLPAQYQPPGSLARTYPLGGNYALVAGNSSGSLLIDEASSANSGRIRLQVAALPANTDVGCTVMVPLI